MTNEEINPMKNKKVYISEKILEKEGYQPISPIRFMEFENPENLKKLHRKQQNLIRKQNTAKLINDLIWVIRDIDIEKASDKEIEILEKSIADIDFLIKEFGAM